MKKKTKRALPAQAIPNYYRWLLMVAVIGTPFFALYGQWFGYLPELHMMSWLAVISLILSGIFLCLFSPRITSIDSALWLPFGLFVAWLSLSAFWAINFYEWLFEWLQWSSVAILGWLLGQSLREQSHFIQLLQLLYGACVLTAVIGIGQHWGLIEWIQQGAPPAGTFFNRNIANQFIVFSFPAGLALFLYSQLLQGSKKQFEWLYGLTLSVVGAYVFYSGTRAAALSLLIQFFGFLLWLLWDWKQSKIKHRPSMLQVGQRKKVVFAAMLLWLLLIHIGPSGIKIDAIHAYIYSVELSDNTEYGEVKAINNFTRDSGRTPLWLNTLVMAKEHAILGVGLGNWPVVYPLYHQAWLDDSKFSMVSSPTNTHNDFLQYMVELGVIGMGLLLWLLWRYVHICVNVITQDNPSTSGFIALAALLSLLGLVVDANFSFPLQMPMPKVVLIIWLVAVSYLFAGKKKPIATRSLAMLGPVFGVLLLVGSLFMYQWQQRWYQAEVANRKATADKRYERFETMHANALESSRLNPLRKRLLHFVAMGYELQNDPKQALQAYQQQLNDYPYLLYALYQSMHQYLKIGEYAKAKQMLERYIVVRPTDAIIYKSLAVIEMNYLQQLDQAIPNFRKALELDPNVEDASEIKRLLKTYSQ